MKTRLPSLTNAVLWLAAAVSALALTLLLVHSATGKIFIRSHAIDTSRIEASGALGVRIIIPGTIPSLSPEARFLTMQLQMSSLKNYA